MFIHISVHTHNTQLWGWSNMHNAHCTIQFELDQNYLWKWIGVNLDSNWFHWMQIEQGVVWTQLMHIESSSMHIGVSSVDTT